MSGVVGWLRARDPGLWTVRGALCATVATALSCALCLHGGDRAQTGVAYLSAFFVASLDTPNAPSTRIRRLVAGVTLVTLMAWLGPACTPYPWLLGAIVIVLSAASVLVSCVHPSWSALATVSLVMFVGMIGPAADLTSPARWAATGGGVAALSMLVLWPVRRDRVRWVQLGGVMRGLARVFETMRVRLQGDEAQQKAHEAALNACLADMRRSLVELMVGPHPYTRGYRALMGGAAVGRALLAMASGLEGLRRALHEQGRTPDLFALLDTAYQDIATWLEGAALPLHDQKPEVDVSTRALEATHARAIMARDEACRRVQSGQSGVNADDEVVLAVGVERLLARVIEFARQLRSGDWGREGERSPLEIFREFGVRGRNAWRRHVLHLQSPVVVQALRLAAAGLLAVVLTWLLGIERSGWTSVTVATAMQANFRDTLHSTLRKALAIVAGSGVALLLLAAHLSGTAIVALVVVAMFLSGIGPMLAEGVDIFFTTVVMVTLIVTIGGVEALPLVEVRLENLALGSAVVMLSILCLWPRWGQNHLPGAVESVLAAVRTFVIRLGAALAGAHDADALDEARVQCYIALDDASRVLGDALREPRRCEVEVDDWMAILVSANRLFGLYVGLMLHVERCDLPHEATLIHHLMTRTASEIEGALARLAGAEVSIPLPSIEVEPFHSRLLLALERDLSKPQYAEHVMLFTMWRSLEWELERLRIEVAKVAPAPETVSAVLATAS